MGDKTQLIADLRQRVAKIPPLPDEPHFFTSDETIVRFLKSRDWNLAEAERMLIDTIEYRRRTRPLVLDCTWCHKRPGFHSMRQVGHDEAGRPVIYANFAQASTHKNSTEDSVAHVTYLIENAKRTMSPGVSTWVFVIDCTGMTLSSCNPKLGYGVTNVLSRHYPERLGLVICLNHSPVFNGVWKAIKKFLQPQTTAKVKLVRSKSKLTELFSELFNDELSRWLQEEISLNKQKPLPTDQMEFWNPPVPRGNAHDPRGCADYVRQYIDTFRGSGQPTVHKPHPNIVDHLNGHEVAAVALSTEELRERERAQSVVEIQLEEGLANEAEGEDQAFDLDIPSDLQIPATALPLSATS